MAPVVLCLILLVVNLFTPIVFNIDANNIYSLMPLSLLVVGFSYSYFFYALVLYVHMRRSTAGLRFFPGWALLFPVVVGGSVQLVFPTAPVFWATVCIGIAGTITGLQNEDIYRDRLTGLFNRTYLEHISTGKLKESRDTRQ